MSVNSSNQVLARRKMKLQKYISDPKSKLLSVSNQQIFPESERNLVNHDKIEINTKDENSAICLTLI